MAASPTSAVRSGWGRLVATLAAVVLGSAALTVGVQTSAQAADTWNPYGITVTGSACTVSTYYQAQNVNETSTQLYSAQFDAGQLVYTEIGSSPGFNYNAIALDPGTNALYGIAHGTGTDADGRAVSLGDLLYVDRTTGEVYDIGLPSGITAQQSYLLNAATADDGVLYLASSGSQSVIWSVDLATGVATSIALSKTVSLGADMALLDGYLWSRQDSNGSFVRVEVATGAVSIYAAPSGIPSYTGGNSNTGGVFALGSGNLGFIINGGTTVQIDVGDPASPTLTLVAVYSSPSGAGTDGASCISPSTDLQIVKTADAVVSVDGTITWQITVTNIGEEESSGWVVTDVVPSAYTNIDAVSGGGVVTGHTVVYTGGLLEAGGSVTLTITAHTPTTTGCYTNEATVVGNETDPNADNDVSSVSTCVARGELTWQKVDSDGIALAGSQWLLTASDGAVTTVVDNGTNDVDPTVGSVAAAILVWGDYTLTETAAPTGYALSTGSWSATIGADATSVDLGAIENTAIDGTLTWQKVDPDGTALAGSQWTLAGPDGTVAVVDNGDNDTDPTVGSVSVAGLAWGDYTLTETAAPTGYALPTGTWSATIGAASTTVDLGAIENTEIAGTLSWQKVDASGSVLAGSQWSLAGPDGTVAVVDNGDNDTDPTVGLVSVAGLAWGDYTLTETAAPTGYALSTGSWSATIGADATSVDLGAIENTAIDGTLTWQKVDPDGTALAGSQWTLTGSDGTVTVVDNGDNDTDPAIGSVSVTGLAWGDYTLTETVAPTGYVLPGTVFAVAIGATSTTVDLGAIENTAIDGALSWQKVDGSGAVLAGSQWSLSGPDGTVTVVDNGENDADPTVGLVSVADLAWGDYTLTETVAPTGYALSTGSWSATIGADATSVDLGAIENTAIGGTLTWQKVDPDGTALAGSQWSLSASDGTVTTVVDNGENDADPTVGSVSVTGLAWGDYTLTETVAPTGYVLPGTVFAVAIGATSTSVDLGTIENTAIDGTLSWQKVDTSGNALPGSQWALTAPDGTVTTVVDNGANDTDATVGSLSVAGLAWGDYTLTETVAPTGYARSSTVFTATIGATTTAVDLGEIQNIKYESQVLSAPDDDPTSTASTSTSDVSSASSSSLATTGADVPFWVVATAGGLLLSGLVLTLVAAVRRRRTAITPERRS